MVALHSSLDALAVALREFAPLARHMEPHLEAAIAQATTESGKLVRARLAHEAARTHGLAEIEALQLACAVEYFHTASLLLDDLPCMDDAATRRGLPCVHKLHGEATSILAALALINHAYALIGLALVDQPAALRLQAIACVDVFLGPTGLVGGQAADLRYGEDARGVRAISRIAAGKTGSLFWMSVYLPALTARPNDVERQALKALCVYWGLVFQAIDDLGDVEKGSDEAGKTTGRDRLLARPNLAIEIGVTAARARIARLTRLAETALRRLEAQGSRWAYLRRFQGEAEARCQPAATVPTTTSCACVL